MALHKKRIPIERFRPDVLILQEVSRKDVEAIDAPFRYWVERIKSKGLGIVGYNHALCSIDASYHPDLPWFLSLVVGDLRILAVWACSISYRRRYVRIMHEAIDHYRSFLTSQRALVIGDFNRNASLDRNYRRYNHSGLVGTLATLGMTNFSPRVSGEAYGCESAPTRFQDRRLSMPYHFNIAFVSEAPALNGTIAVGTASGWLSMSDHRPLIIDLVSPHEAADDSAASSFD